ncbi:hypothetical protein Gpo141_00012489 [Globisporangium polare]
MSPAAPPMALEYKSFPAPGAPTTCRYAGKKCLNLRALKRNGSLHNLCHYHRVRANQNQRRMELRRRIKRVHEERAMGVMMHPAYAPPMPGNSISGSAPTTMSYAAMMRSADPRAAHWGHFGGPSPANDMLPPPPPQDHLSDLFSAPEHGGSYAVDIPYAATVMSHQDSKQSIADLHYQFPTSFPRLDQRRGGAFPSHSYHSPLDHQQVIWYDQDLLLPL